MSFDVTLCIEGLRKSRFNALTLLDCLEELCVEVTLTLSQLCRRGVAFALRVYLGGLNCRPCLGKLTRELVVGGSRIGQLR